MKLRRMIRNSQNKISEFADKKRKDILYKMKNKVFLLIKNIDTMRSSKKLNYKIKGHLRSFERQKTAMN